MSIAMEMRIMQLAPPDEVVVLPFLEKNQLTLDQTEASPNPLISFDDKPAVLQSITAELSTERLERLYGMLFLVSNRRNISPLHHQLIKGRQALITERADLHLVWNYDRIFLGAKQASAVKAWQEAQGFLRTYASLIQHPSDLHLAKTLHLVPDHTEWNTWCHFICGFAQLRDRQVAPRYHYGELRLTRLNFWCKIFLRGQSYLDTTHNYGTYFGHFFAPYLFLFSAVTVVLGCLQVALQQDPQGPMATLASAFVPLAMHLTFVGVLSFPIMYIAFQLRELLCFIVWNRGLT
ncbi:hypothetical protein PG988_010461 [Apiospora saccharicola]